MKYEFDFQMDEATLNDFYKSSNPGGFLWTILGIVAIALAFLAGETTPLLYRILYVLFGLLFIFYIPWDLKRKAKKQIRTNPYYAAPIHYILDENGVTTTQGENEATLAWENFSKVKLTKQSIFIYMRNRNACILSQEVFGDELAEASEWIRAKVEHR